MPSLCPVATSHHLGPPEPPKKKRSAVLDGILQQLEDSESDGEEQSLRV